MKHNPKLKILCIILSLIYLFIGMNSTNYEYLLYRRISRLIAVIFASYLINIATVYFQSMTHNRILTPALLGFDRLYILIQVVLVFCIRHYIPSLWVFVIVVLVMTLVSVLIYSTVLRILKQDLFVLLLVGTILGSLFSSLTSSMQMMMDPNEFSIIQNKSFASFNNIQVNVLGLSLIVSLIGFVFYAFIRNKVDVIALGEHQAKNLGVDVSRFQYHALIMIAVFISITTALVGPISFMGLLSTNIARESIEDYRAKSLINYSTGLTIAILLAAQILFERVFKLNTSISVIINIIGGIYFIRLMLKERFS